MRRLVACDGQARVRGQNLEHDKEGRDGDGKGNEDGFDLVHNEEGRRATVVNLWHYGRFKLPFHRVGGTLAASPGRACAKSIGRVGGFQV